MAGFEVYLNGRFWVSPEALRTLQAFANLERELQDAIRANGWDHRQ